MVYARDGQWDRADRSFRRAIELDPNQSLLRSDYAWWLLAVLGRYDEALRQLRAAELSDPLSAEVRLLAARVLIGLRRYDEAAAGCARPPNGGECIALVRLGQGRFAEAIDALTRRTELANNPQNRGYLGFAYARNGLRSEAERMATVSRFPNERALILAGLGDKTGTLDALNQMATLGAQRVGHYLNSSEFDFLRGDPDVQAFRSKVGLPPQIEAGSAHAP
jgi:tetratricopeptide (TPR) repeat protein